MNDAQLFILVLGVGGSFIAGLLGIIAFMLKRFISGFDKFKDEIREDVVKLFNKMDSHEKDYHKGV